MLTPLVYLAILPLVTGWCSVNEIARAVGAHGKLIPACPTNAHIRKVIRIVEPLVVDAADDEKSFTFPNFVEGLFLGNIPIRTYGADWLHWYGEGFRFRFVRFGRCSLPFDAWGRNHHIDAWRWLIRNQGAQRIAIWPRTCSLHSGSNGAGCPLLIAKIWPAVVIIGAVDLPKLAETTRTLVGTPALFFSTIPTPFPIMTGRLIIACCSILLARDTFCL